VYVSNRQAFKIGSKATVFRESRSISGKNFRKSVSPTRNIFSTDSRFRDIPETKMALASYNVRITGLKLYVSSILNRLISAW